MIVCGVDTSLDWKRPVLCQRQITFILQIPGRQSVHTCEAGHRRRAMPDLSGRIARCGRGCGKEVPSSPLLGMFEFEPNPERPGVDSFYCGCGGWD